MEKLIRLLGAIGMLASVAFPVAAQFPAKPIRMIVPFTPGGPADMIARPIAQGLTERWGQQVIVEYRPGAGGNIGAEALAKSPPDGYTLIESGLPGYEVLNWMGFIVPARTPQEIIARLSAEIRAILEVPDTRERLLKQGLVPAGNTPEAFDAYIRSEIAKWSKVVKQSGIKPD